MHALLELYDYTEFPIIGELLGRFAVLDNDGRKNALEYMNFLKSIGKFPATIRSFACALRVMRSLCRQRRMRRVWKF